MRLQFSKAEAGRVSTALLVLVAGCLLVTQPSELLAQVHNESEIKVAYVYNLTKYVAWPTSTGPLVLGFVGDGPMGEALEKMLTGRASESRPIRVILAPKNDSLLQCDLVYVAYSSPEKTAAALKELHSKSVLTVGDSDSFTKAGGMVGLVRSGEQIQMQVNLEAVQAAGLKISSRVLALATIVHSGPEVKN